MSPSTWGVSLATLMANGGLVSPSGMHTLLYNFDYPTDIQYLTSRVSAVKQNKKAAVYFWPGYVLCLLKLFNKQKLTVNSSEANISGIHATYYKVYNESVTYPERVDAAIEWAHLPASERPSLIMMYFSAVSVDWFFYGTFVSLINWLYLRLITLVMDKVLTIRKLSEMLSERYSRTIQIRSVRSDSFPLRSMQRWLN